ncbi:patatin-like phospholipase family protein [Bacillus sp. V3B]|uniref:patatin-like phospholipase family protein n=1 Tax=Bacillus sp. V3B TaxID=2804915 RepID=UPI00210E9A1C|nr:patatin-like phospholipase family protein [Bacillus sp. V3B]MCQ6273732.1 patatin-like phospholipase family protein [Bacillus sp. V3B]
MKIDGVFSGGGIKGIALIGAFEELENQGFEFERVAGTSAGAIIAALIAAKYTSKEIYQLLDELDLEMLLDERKTFLPFTITKWFFLYWRLGLYKGNELENWITDKLAKKGIRTFADLPPKQLRFIASDITNGRLVVLPDDLIQYGIDPSSFSVARAIRMSCSLPYFFEPVRLRVDRHTSLIVDGAVLSNFPMWLFNADNIKRVRPIIGVKLSHDQEELPQNKIGNAIQLFGALFETMKDAHDGRYISRKHEKDVMFIPSTGVLTTEFTLTEEKKQLLMQQGRDSAKKFLTTWNLIKM